MLNPGPIFLTSKRLRPELPLFVFLPGMDGTGQLFRTQTDGLEMGFDVRCLAIPPTDLTSWDELAEQTVGLIHQELEKVSDRPVYLCGESFGGCLALKVALHSPHLFKRVILANPASSFKQRPFLNWSSTITNWMPEPVYRLSSLWLMPFLARLERLTPEDRQALLKAVQSVPQKTSIWRLSLLHEFAIPEMELQKITQPVLLIAGAADRLLPSLTEVQRLQRSLPNSKTVVLPYSGHACLLEADVNLYEIMQAHNFLETSVAAEAPTAHR
ncbi:MAG: alpha/beta hydrolase [Oscillatoriales cyanobacterium C42_A2020_001]|nr:alpha/beta hydrolase [Leptolyngbyaceae cyanobacterium C42_A2020_001]